MDIIKWTCSYYDSSKRKWIHGMLRVSARHIQFCVPDGNETSTKVLKTVLFDEMQDVRKAKSSYIFKCVVVTTKYEQHWLGSLPNLDSSYNVLEHFLRNRLLPTDEVSGGSKYHSTKGQALLRIAAESEKNLSKAATQLHRQGEQLDCSLGTMFDLHENLNTADKLLTSLESWLGHWKIPKRYVPEEMEFVDSKGIPTVHDFPVVFHRQSGENSRYDIEKILFNPGLLRVSKDGVTIMDAKQMLCHHYNPKEISRIQVITPWKVKVVQFQIGKPDKAFILVSSKMVEAIHTLNILFGRKFEYEALPENSTEELLAIGSSSGLFPSPEHADMKDDLLKQPRFNLMANQTQASGNLQQQQQQRQDASQTMVSAEETEELGDIISRMKSIALDVGREQDRQMDTIESLTGSVDRANARLDTANRRMKKAL